MTTHEEELVFKEQVKKATQNLADLLSHYKPEWKESFPTVLKYAVIATSQQEVAKAVGTSEANVSRWVRGVSTPNRLVRSSVVRVLLPLLMRLDVQRAA